MAIAESARSRLLRLIVDEVAANGLADRSLRDVATAAGSSHRMLNYHFGSRAGLVAAIVEFVETSQRELLAELAATISDPQELVLAHWQRVSSSEMRPFVRLFFEGIALTGGRELAEPWIQSAQGAASQVDSSADDDLLRLGIAVTRGLLVEVLLTDDVAAATRSLERFLDLAENRSL